MKKACLLLEDGFYQEGLPLGAEGEVIGEVVFNTSMTGYQEILTDPSYKGQIVCMTYPLIGNYGINSQDVESSQIQVEGFIIKEKSKIYSNWRAEKSLEEYLRENNIVGIEGVDTRAITKHLRVKGSMKGIISTTDFNSESLKEKLEKFPSIVGRDLVKKVFSNQIYEWEQPLISEFNPLISPQGKVVVIDCGVKFSILRNLKVYFEKVIVIPPTTSLEEILEFEPQGILFSGGPGDPTAVEYVIELAKKIIEKLEKRELRIGVLGISLGHQILGLALGGKIYKLKFGHHGGSYPVKDLETAKIEMTVQNHHFCVDIKSLPTDLEPTYINLYDDTLEGMAHKRLPIFSVQFHPRTELGPFEATGIFSKFKRMIELTTSF
ncbi:MAG: glutamine-hydrolyzing carbamoyl-phosphate synthase small subunit [Candidatus Omnitrophica bacterium]|nr:glutamine-hydrolyzing carbamoyl-phosphate synthase small subunit [Candidatus Omnitrophota bacterium]